MQVSQNSDRKKSGPSWPCNVFLLSTLVPVAVAAIIFIYRLDSFDASPLPAGALIVQPLAVPRGESHMLRSSDFIGVGRLPAPEDLAYEPESGIIYTGCMDGWIKRVTVDDSVADSAVEDWVRVGGHPLGIAVGKNEEIIVAHPDKGLLKVSKEGKVQLLTNEAEGLKLKLTNGVDVASDGVIYFTDSSYKYGLSEFMLDILEGKPHGRLLSYDPSTNLTTVLVRNLYFANGVAVSPDQTFVVYCETPMRRCRKYCLKGERKGMVDAFIENMPVMPDNVKCDGDGQFWIAFGTEVTPFTNLMFKQPLLRKLRAILIKYVELPPDIKNTGVLAVDLQGRPIAHFYHPKAQPISTGLRVGNHLYSGSLKASYITRFDLGKNAPPRATS